MKVEFVLTNPLLVDHFGPVLSALQSHGFDSAFVCLPPNLFALDRERKRRLHASCIAALESGGMPYRTRIDPDSDVAITALGSNELHLYSRFKIKFRYGVSLHRAAIHHNGAMTRGFDGLLAHGPFERDLFSHWFPSERIKIMGIPRHDAHHRRPPDKQQARSRLSIEVPGEHRVIAYLPTWSVQSSLTSFSNELVELARRHVLLVKPHPLSLVSPTELERLRVLRDAGARLFEVESLHEVLAAADIAITDATSGATPEVVMLSAQTPLALLTTRNLEELFTEIAQAGPLVSEPSALSGTISSLLCEDAYRDRRAQLKLRLFSDQDGRAAERAVECIVELTRMPKISGSPGLLERTFPRPYRIARGRYAALGCKLAAIPPRNAAAKW